MENPDMDLFNQNLQQSLALCQAHHVQLMFLVLASEGQTPTTPIHPYEKAMMDFAEREHIPLINMIPTMSAKDKSTMFMDPDHATVAGYQVIADELRKSVERLPSYTSVCGAPAATTLNSAQTAPPVQPAAPLASR
jgi:lysophospholipase L1-like esterase